MYRKISSRLIGSLIGLALIGLGLFMVGKPFIETWFRGNQDASALSAWKSGGSSNLAKHIAVTNLSETTPCHTTSAPSSDYALVTFPSLSQYGYQGVAGNGTWAMLNVRSMVHWYGSPNPGQYGNVIIAFHREPDFEYINQLNVGDVVTIESRDCNIYQYTVTQKWDLAPDQVTQLVPTNGYNLTLITCTPWWQDYDRFVWRATLTAINGKPFTS